MTLARRHIQMLLCLGVVAGAAGCGTGKTALTSTGGGGRGSPNFTSCSSQQVPNWRTVTFQSNSEAAIQQIVAHHSQIRLLDAFALGWAAEAKSIYRWVGRMPPQGPLTRAIQPIGDTPPEPKPPLLGIATCNRWWSTKAP